MKVSKTAIEICNALIFLENTVGGGTCGTVNNLRSENSDFIKICKNEGPDNVGDIASNHKLMLPVMFASITLK